MALNSLSGSEDKTKYCLNSSPHSVGLDFSTASPALTEEEANCCSSAALNDIQIVNYSQAAIYIINKIKELIKKNLDSRVP